VVDAISEPHHIEKQAQSQKIDDYFFGSLIYLITELGTFIQL